MRYLFRHVLMRDAVYNMQLRRHLCQMHRKAAEAIEEAHVDHLAPHYADLAYHYGQAEDGDKERLYAKLAGEQAAAQFANAEAVAYLGRALALTPTSAKSGRYELLLAREKVYDLQGARQAQTQDLMALEQYSIRDRPWPL